MGWKIKMKEISHPVETSLFPLCCGYLLTLHECRCWRLFICCTSLNRCTWFAAFLCVSPAFATVFICKGCILGVKRHMLFKKKNTINVLMWGRVWQILILAQTRYLVIQFCALWKKQIRHLQPTKRAKHPEATGRSTLREFQRTQQHMARLSLNPGLRTSLETSVWFARFKMFKSWYSLEIHHCMWNRRRSVPNQRPVHTSVSQAQTSGP